MARQFSLTPVNSLALVLVAFGGQASWAQDAAVKPAQARAYFAPTVSVELVDPEERIHTWTDLRLLISASSGSSDAGIGVLSLTLHVPRSLAIEIPGATIDRSGGISLLDQPFEIRSPGERDDLPPVQLTSKSLKSLGLEILPVLVYRSRDEVAVVTMEYRDLNSDQKRSTTSQLRIKVSGHPLGMYLGALTGSALVALLLAFVRTRKDILKDIVRRFARGSLATAIAVLIFQTINDINFPVAVVVQDFYGGVLLGLFGDQVAKAILNRIAAGPRSREGGH